MTTLLPADGYQNTISFMLNVTTRGAVHMILKVTTEGLSLIIRRMRVSEVEISISWRRSVA